jgi:hypothetical protein
MCYDLPAGGTGDGPAHCVVQAPPRPMRIDATKRADARRTPEWKR